MRISCVGCSSLQVNRNQLSMEHKHSHNRSAKGLEDQDAKVNVATKAVSGAQTVMVVVDATAKITEHAMEWAVTNIVKFGDCITFLAVIPSSFSGWKLWLRFADECTQNGKRLRTSERKNDVLQNQINANCSEMLRQLHRACKAKQVSVTVKIVTETRKGIAAVEAGKLSATWVVLDRQMRKEAKYCLEQLQCNLAIVSQKKTPKILRMNLNQNLPQPCSAYSSMFLRSVSNVHKGFDAVNTDTNVKSGNVKNPEFEKGSIYSSTDLGTPFTASDCGMSSSPIFSDQTNSSCSRAQSSLVTQQKACTTSDTKLTITADNRNDISTTNVQGTVSPRIKSNSNEARKCASFFFASLQRIWDTKTETAGGSSLENDEPIQKRKSFSAPVSRSNSFVERSPDSIIDSKLLWESKLFKEAKTSKSSKLVGFRDDTAASDMQKLSDLFKSQRHGTNGSKVSASQEKDPISKHWQSSGTALHTSKYRTQTFGKTKTADSDMENKPTKWSLERTSSIRKAVAFSKNSPAGPPPLCSVCQHKSPIFGRPPLQFSYGELQKATSGFSDDNFLSEGAFGPVHKGVLPDGQQIAVKQHRMAGSQGDKEFCAEVEVLSCAQHRNVVMLLGFCIDGGRRLLVYEFVCNGSLDKHLFGKHESPLEWKARKKIAIGAARGLRFLHQDCRVGCIVHRDLRPNNILLTHDFEPLVGDFGLARWQPDGELEEETRVIGTFGYLSPEYARAGQVSEKADVYSFGVILLELVTGRKAIDFSCPKGQQCLTNWARPLMEDHAAYELVDPLLENRYPEHEVYCTLKAASLCIRHNPHSRPRMAEVLRILEGDLQAGSFATLSGSISALISSDETSSFAPEGGFRSSLPSNVIKRVQPGTGVVGASFSANPVCSLDENGMARATADETQTHAVGNDMPSASGDRDTTLTEDISPRTTRSRDVSPFPQRPRPQNGQFIPKPPLLATRFPISEPTSDEASSTGVAHRKVPSHQRSGRDDRPPITTRSPNSDEPASPTAVRKAEHSSTTSTAIPNARSGRTRDLRRDHLQSMSLQVNTVAPESSKLRRGHA